MLLSESLFDAQSLPYVRHAVAAVGARVGLAGLDLYRFVLAGHEAAVNAVFHGGGHGWIRLWWADDSLFAEITDHGPGIPPDRRADFRPEPDDNRGRGLWLMREVCAEVDITCDTTGTRGCVSF